jgi:hypothetical protein
MESEMLYSGVMVYGMLRFGAEVGGIVCYRRKWQDVKGLPWRGHELSYIWLHAASSIDASSVMSSNSQSEASRPMTVLRAVGFAGGLRQARCVGTRHKCGSGAMRACLRMHSIAQRDSI